MPRSLNVVTQSISVPFIHNRGISVIFTFLLKQIINSAVCLWNMVNDSVDGSDGDNDDGDKDDGDDDDDDKDDGGGDYGRHYDLSLGTLLILWGLKK